MRIPSLISLIVCVATTALAAEPLLVGDWPAVGQGDLSRQRLPLGRCSLALAPSGRRIVAASDSDEIVELDIKAGTEINALTIPTAINSQARFGTALAYSADGSVLAALTVRRNSDGRPASKLQLRIWNQGSRREISVPVVPAGEQQPLLALSPDGKWVAGGVTDSDSATVWRTQDLHVEKEIPATEAPGPRKFKIHGMLWSPDSKQLVVQRVDARRGLTELVACPLAQGSDRRSLGHLAVDDFETEYMSFSRDAKTLLTVSQGAMQIRYWNVAAGGMPRPPVALADPSLDSTTWRVSPYGAVMAVVTKQRREILIYDLNAGQQRARIQLAERVDDSDIVLERTGRYFAASSNQQKLKTWDLSPVLADEPNKNPPTAVRGEPARSPNPRQAKYQLPRIVRHGVSFLSVTQPGDGDELDVLPELADLDSLTCNQPLTVQQAETICGCGQLRYLNLSDNPSITDAHLQRVANCRQLTELYLSGTSVTGEFLKGLPKGKSEGDGLGRLETLDLGRTLVSGEMLEHLARLPRLKSLVLSGTEISDRSLPRLGQLVRLKSLALDGSEVTVSGLAALQRLTTLRDLTLPEFIDPNEDPNQQPELADRIVEKLAPLDNLETLDLQNRCTFSDDGLRHVAMLDSLRELRIEGGRFTPAGLRHLRRMSQLQTLRFQSAKLTDEGLAELKDMPQIRALEIYDSNEFTDKGLEHIAAMTQLRAFGITIINRPPIVARSLRPGIVRHGTTVTDTGIENLRNLTRLETLVLDGTGISDVGLKALAGLARLETLSVRSPAVTAEGVLQLRGATGLQRVFVKDWKQKKSVLLAAFPHLQEDPKRTNLLPSARQERP